MDIDEFMDINTPIRRRIIQANSLDVHRLAPMEDVINLEQRKRIGTNFAQPLKEQQEVELEEKFKQIALSSCNPSTQNTDCESESGETVVPDARLKDQITLYGRYAFNQPLFNPDLPIHGHREEIREHIRNSPVLVIKGETGCGKSTQVPQIILDESYTRREYCNIVVTQPRRIAAITLSEQVSKERGYENNTLVGYQIGLDKKVSDDTRLTYVTTGVLLEKLIQNKRMDMYTHIILDEIHERDEDMEFLLIAIKRFLIKNPFDTKIILMSATIDTSQFSKYFRLPCPGGNWLNAPTLTLTGKRQHSIHTFYLEDLIQLGGAQAAIDYEKPGIDINMYRVACTIIASFSKTEFIGHGLCFLLFLPGIHEIAQMHRTLEGERER